MVDTDVLDAALLRRGWTAADLARDIGLSTGHLSCVRTGRKGISAKKLFLAAKALNVEVLTLARRDTAEDVA